MKRPAGKKRIVRKKPARKPAGAKHAPNGGTALAARIVTAPYLVDAKVAQARVAVWLAGLPAAEAKQLKPLLGAHSTAGTLLQSLGESSPYLWELASGDATRLLRLLTCDPDAHLAALLAKSAAAVAATEDEAEAMRLLRRMKAEAALLIALADIGGVWPVMRATRALTDVADTAVDAAARFVLAEAAREKRLAPNDKAKPHIGSGYIVLAMGKMGAFELNYSSDIDLIVFYERSHVCAAGRRRSGRAVRSRDAAYGEALAGAHRRRLRVPHRSAAATRSGLDRDRHLHCRRPLVLRKYRAELGARGDDQGARLRRRHRRGGGDP